jgi:nucleoside-diphosphate-sugar epimerase
MKILVTGCNGFIAKEIRNSYLNEQHDFVFADRKMLDVSCPTQTRTFLSIHEFDAVIHTANTGGRKNIKETFDDFLNNLKMFQNLINNFDKFKLLINFGSGAEFNRFKNVRQVQEIKKSEIMPLDYYGISKNIISNYIQNTPENIYSFRLFGCFGRFEKKDRLVKSTIEKIIKEKPAIIHQNRIMDFFSAEDVCIVIDYYLQNYDKKTLPKDLNLCYNKKRDLNEISLSIFNFMNKKPNIKILKPGYSPEYTGSSKLIDSLDLNLKGFDKSLKKVIQQVVKDND